MEQSKLHFSTLLVLTFLALGSSRGHASTYQDISSIALTAESFALSKASINTHDKIEARAGKIDTRLKLHRCDVPLSAFNPNNIQQASRMTVGVSCEGRHQWTVYVPVEINHFTQVVTTKHSLNRGDTISRDDLAIIEVNVNRVRGQVYTDVEQVIGATVKRRVRRNGVVTSKNTCFVCKGKPVTIAVESNALRVQTKGVALMDGTLGDMIRVRNTQSKKELEAMVSENNEVVIRI